MIGIPKYMESWKEKNKNIDPATWSCSLDKQGRLLPKKRLAPVYHLRNLDAWRNWKLHKITRFFPDKKNVRNE